jgi:hypothetical protein
VGERLTVSEPDHETVAGDPRTAGHAGGRQVEAVERSGRGRLGMIRMAQLNATQMIEPPLAVEIPTTRAIDWSAETC